MQLLKLLSHCEDHFIINPQYIYGLEGCSIHPICNGSSKGLTTRHGSFNPSTRNHDPSTGSHFARFARESRNVGGSTGSSRSVTDGDDPSIASHFARDLNGLKRIEGY